MCWKPPTWQPAATAHCQPRRGKSTTRRAPKIMAATDDKELAYGYFSQTLLPDYIEEHGVDWDVVYDARGHFEEPHTNRRLGCGTIEVGNYLAAAKDTGHRGCGFRRRERRRHRSIREYQRILFCEKEGLQPAVQGGETRQAL